VPVANTTKGAAVSSWVAHNGVAYVNLEGAGTSLLVRGCVCWRQTRRGKCAWLCVRVCLRWNASNGVHRQLLTCRGDTVLDRGMFACACVCRVGSCLQDHSRALGMTSVRLSLGTYVHASRNVFCT
jgi:hypothetical protein